MLSEMKLSRLIPKNHFCSMELFRAEPLISWPYTDAILFTAYDIYRSNDFWLDRIVSSGLTLKDGLIDLGFPKNKALVADTGVFEVEARKAGIAKELGIQVDIELSNLQIFEAYELSGADYFVAPDEIVLPDEKIENIRRKIKIIKQNLIDLLEIIHPSKIIAVIQGHTESIIDDLFDFYRSQGITHFAMGGIIPLYHHNKTTLEKVLYYVRKITRDFWLHVFGLPHMGLLHYYLHEIEIDSVDTSALLYITARRRYLLGSRPEPVRKAVFEECDCDGCQHLSPDMSTTSSEFFLNLYIHNLRTAAILSENKEKTIRDRSPAKRNIGENESRSIQKAERTANKQSQGVGISWMTADVAYEQRKEKVTKQTSRKDSLHSKSTKDIED